MALGSNTARDGMAVLLNFEPFDGFVVAVVLQTSNTADQNNTALYLRGHQAPCM